MAVVRALLPRLVATVAVELAFELLLKCRCCVIASLAALTLRLLRVLPPLAGFLVALSFLFAVLLALRRKPTLLGLCGAVYRSLLITSDSLQMLLYLLRHGGWREESEVGRRGVVVVRVIAWLDCSRRLEVRRRRCPLRRPVVSRTSFDHLRLFILLLPASAALHAFVDLMVCSCFIFFSGASFILRVEHSHEILDDGRGLLALLGVLLAPAAGAHLLEVGELLAATQEVTFLARVAVDRLHRSVSLLGAPLAPRRSRVLIRPALRCSILR